MLIKKKKIPTFTTNENAPETNHEYNTKDKNSNSNTWGIEY